MTQLRQWKWSVWVSGGGGATNYDPAATVERSVWPVYGCMQSGATNDPDATISDDSCVFDYCASMPCQNRAAASHLKVVTCVNVLGFEGIDCQVSIDFCASAPCENGGICIRSKWLSVHVRCRFRWNQLRNAG